MKTTIKLGLSISLLWLVSLVFLSGMFFPPGGQETGGAMGVGAELNHLTNELHRMRRQNDELRKQAKELRDLVETKEADPEEDQAQLLKNQLVKANNLVDILKKESSQTYNHKDDPAVHSSCSSGPSAESEKLRRRIHNDVVEIWYFLKSELQKIKLLSTNEKMKEKVNQILVDGGHQQRAILVDIYNLSRIDNNAAWRDNEAKELSDLVQRRFQYMQNPADCSKAKKIVCNLNKGCGYGCQVHHVAYCMIVAYGTQRTLILQSKGWRYAPEGWEKFFLPLSETCVDRRGESTTRWGSTREKMANTQVIDLPIVDGIHPRPDFLPLAIPEDLSKRLMRLHGNPIVWWMGQVLKYILRPQPNLANELELARQKLGFKRPIVG